MTHFFKKAEDLNNQQIKITKNSKIIHQLIAGTCFHIYINIKTGIIKII